MAAGGTGSIEKNQAGKTVEQKDVIPEGLKKRTAAGKSVKQKNLYRICHTRLMVLPGMEPIQMVFLPGYMG